MMRTSIFALEKTPVAARAELAEVVVPWILSQKGEAVPLEPPELVEAVRKAARATLDSLPSAP